MIFLRGARFASRLGFDIDSKTIEAMKKHAPEIAKVSQERIYKELKKMASQEGAKFAHALEILDEVGLLEYILPEVADMANYEHSPEHHPEGHVLQHTLAALRTNTLKDPLINLSILLHDVGKVKTHSISDKGLHQYIGHAKEAIDIIDTISKRLKIDNETKDAMQFAAANHMKFHEILKMKKSTIAKLMNSSHFDLLKSVALADAKARGKLFDQEEWNQIENKLLALKDKYKNKDAIDTLRKVINGKLVMQLRPDIKPGPKMGDIIKATLDYVLDNEIDVDNDIDKIHKYIKNY